MENNIHQIVICPSCLNRYRVPDSFLGKKISCKKCGAVFQLELEARDRNKVSPKSPVDATVDIEDISRDDQAFVIGALCIKHGFATKEQVHGAIDIQERAKKAGRAVPLGNILVEQGVLDEKKLRFLVSLQNLTETRKADLKFGEIAVKNQLISRERLKKALNAQERIFREKGSAIPIGTLLIKAGYITEQQLQAVLSRQETLKTAASDKETVRVEDSARAGAAKQEIGFDLSVSDDKLSATITPGASIDASVTTEIIKAFLEEKGVVFGIVDEAEIRDYLEMAASEGGPFKIAAGKAPEPASDGDIHYHFIVDSLKAGKVVEGDHVDFKDRGTTPKVRKGDLLAEKTPARQGLQGMDVLGQPIPIPAAPKSVLRGGPGTEFSDDKRKIFAAIDGRPKISSDGKVSVFRELKIQGDVDLKTGHIDYEGEIIVSGTVQSGFRVVGERLSANEILRAEIETGGDIEVFGGIIGTTIKTDGNVRARHVREAHIEALGDVIVEKEIVDTRIETSGSVLIKKGSVLSSIISAKKGIQAFQIGSEKSKVCNLIVGVDTRVKNEIDAIKQEIASKEKELQAVQKDLDKLDEEAKKIQEELGTKAQEQDRGMVQKRKLQEKTETLKAQGDEEQLIKFKHLLQVIEEEIADREKALETIFNEQDRVEEEISAFEKRAAPYKQEIEALNRRITDLTTLSQSEGGNPEIRIKGSVFPDTTIKAIHSSLILPEKHENIQIKEVKTRGSDNKTVYKIRLSRL